MIHIRSQTHQRHLNTPPNKWIMYRRIRPINLINVEISLKKFVRLNGSSSYDYRLCHF